MQSNRLDQILPTIKRLEKKPSRKLPILQYGHNNDYPRELREIVISSPTASACADVYGNYVFGGGSGTAIDDKLVNHRKLTVRQLNSRLKKDYAIFQGFAVLVQYDLLLNRTFYYIPFENVRLHEPDDYGDIIKCSISSDWTSTKEQVYEYFLYNPDPEAIRLQAEMSGGWQKYSGQVYYFANGSENYPDSLIEPVRYDCITEMKISKFKVMNIHKGFQASQLVTYAGSLTDDQYSDIVTTIKNFQGEDNTNSILFLEVPEVREGSSPMTIAPLTSNNNDKMFEYSEKSCIANIIRAFKGMSPSLIGADTKVGLSTGISGETYKVMQAIYQERTQEDRDTVSRELTELFGFNYRLI